MPKDNRQTRSIARLVAVQALFEIEASRRPFKTVIAEVLAHDLSDLLDADIEPARADTTWVETIVSDAVLNQIKIDQSTNQILAAGWPLAKVDPILRAIFRAAGAEFISETAPLKVIINEYLNVTKAFDDRKQTVGFVNGVLDALGAKLTSVSEG